MTKIKVAKNFMMTYVKKYAIWKYKKLTPLDIFLPNNLYLVVFSMMYGVKLKRLKWSMICIKTLQDHEFTK